ncbi:pantoate--beta-alanine ligase [Chloroflexota bacterium]
MKVAETIAEMKQLRSGCPEPVAFVPTMGYLHYGHLSLVRRARAENRTVIASIFVNPTQFSPNEDFASYPRNTEHDLAMLENEKTDIVFMPSASEIYPPGFDSWVEAGKLGERLEGVSRPTHFRGVTTVVARLFSIIRPTKAYFGQKDSQQLLIIRKLVSDLNMDLEIVTCPTVRESDGLAMSSRNSYLNPEERRAAAVLYQSLELAQQLWSQGEKDAEKIRLEMKNLIQHQPLANIDYISIADKETLEELDEVKPQALVSLAVKIGKPRLIDNIILE